MNKRPAPHVQMAWWLNSVRLHPNEEPFCT